MNHINHSYVTTYNPERFNPPRPVNFPWLQCRRRERDGELERRRLETATDPWVSKDITIYP